MIGIQEYTRSVIAELTVINMEDPSHRDILIDDGSTEAMLRFVALDALIDSQLNDLNRGLIRALSAANVEPIQAAKFLAAASVIFEDFNKPAGGADFIE